MYIFFQQDLYSPREEVTVSTWLSARPWTAWVARLGCQSECCEGGGWCEVLTQHNQIFCVLQRTNSALFLESFLQSGLTHQLIIMLT